MSAPEENNNAEKWTLELSTKVYENALSISKEKTEYLVGSPKDGVKVEGYKYHYIGEIASELDLYSDLFLYLKEKHKGLELMYNKLKARLESNCFSDSKKGVIKEASAIMNLKSNYGWTDRVQTDNNTKISTEISSEDLDKKIEALKKRLSE